MGKRLEYTPNSKIRQALRQLWLRSRERASALKRDKYTCQICGDKGIMLHADHIKPWAYYPELRLVIENGRTLCVPCHVKTPTYSRRGEKAMGQQMNAAFK